MSDADSAIGAQKIFTLFFVTLGPIKLLGPFTRATATLTDDELRALSLRVAGMATLIAIAGGFLGRALMVLTPYGIAAVIALLALSKATGRTDLIVAMLLAVMLLNLLAMAYARFLFRAIGPGLQALGVVLSVLQLALALQIMLAALRGLGVLAHPGLSRRGPPTLDLSRIAP